MSEIPYAAELSRIFSVARIPISVFQGQELLGRYADATDYSLPMILLSALPRKLPPIWVSSTPEDLFFSGAALPGDLLLFFGPVLPYECTREKAAVLLGIFGRKPKDYFDFRRYFLVHAPGNVSTLRACAELACQLLAGEKPPEAELVPYHPEQRFPPVSAVSAPEANYDSMEIENSLLAGT